MFLGRFLEVCLFIFRGAIFALSSSLSHLRFFREDRDFRLPNARRLHLLLTLSIF